MYYSRPGELGLDQALAMDLTKSSWSHGMLTTYIYLAPVIYLYF